MNVEELKIAVEKVNQLFNKIKTKYPDLSGYLVFSSRFGQCNLTTDVIDILQNFPDMIKPSSHKEKGLEIIRTKQPLNGFRSIVNALEVKEDTFIEIRFNKVNLDLIFELQKDDMIFRAHKPQTKASIRIALGILEEIYRRNIIS